MSGMREAQELLDASRKELMWVKSQWPEVIAEACTSIGPVPKLQKELEAKFEAQTKTIYRNLQESGARPSHSIHPPDTKATFTQRLQHWIAEDSGFEAELWDWKLFTSWRRCAKNADTADQEAQKQPSSVDPCLEYFGDLVRYHQHEYDKAVSWVNCWRREARQYREAKKQRRRRHWPYSWPFSDSNEKDDQDDYDEDDGDDDDELSKAKQADIYAIQAEERVSIATKRLEQSKRDFQGILAEVGPSPTSGISVEHCEVQPPPTPPKPQSPQSLPMDRRPSKKKSSAKKDYRRSKKEMARKGRQKQPTPIQYSTLFHRSLHFQIT